IDMICYKAELSGIKVSVVRENYTSGTSYLDGESPDASYYDNKRRIRRGMFRSNKGILINADVNAAYQIMKVGGIQRLPVKEREKVIRFNVA
ncbi:MAG: transposase, partial [Lachnospiraceae bacterium]|nr:transposase [Lachnospiraceae bacterium]